MEAVVERTDREVQDGKEKPLLLLHSCCAPCSSAVLERLAPHFRIIDFFYNPNISPEAEYRHRAGELERLIACMPETEDVRFVEGRYDPQEFFDLVRGLEDVPEGGERCFLCYRQRMEEAAREAVKAHADFFTTTLSISPLKNAEKINEIGEELAAEYGIPHLPSDFKKKNGYLRSIQLSKEYGLYRQDYCGCPFSRAERERLKSRKAEETASAADTEKTGAVSAGR